MDILYIIACAAIVIGFLVVIHEGGHYLAARAFGVRVTEFMVGLPGPNIGITKWGTKFGFTIIPLGGYARVCGMETGKMSEHLKEVLAYVYRRGGATIGDVADGCNLSVEDATDALEELVEWGSVVAPKRIDEASLYLTPAYIPSKREEKRARRLCIPITSYELGDAREVDDPGRLFDYEYSQQYRSLSFWKRSVIVLAGIAVNLLFAIIAFILVYSVIGVDYTDPDGNVLHLTATPVQSVQIGFSFIAMTFQGILSLFNPQTAAETVSQSSSIVGIAYLSADYFAAGMANAVFFMGVISISLGLMNLLPIPPLDGGRFLIEVVQKVTRRDVPMKVLGAISAAGMFLFLCFFIFMLNQDIQRFVLGNW